MAPNEITLTNLNDSHGLIQFDLGPGRIIERYNNFIHIIRLNDYKNSIEKISSSIDFLENKNTIANSVLVTKLKLKELKNKLKTLTPIKRNRRGLINGLGTVIKCITGNMDENDAISINSQISELQSNEEKFENAFKNQNSLNNELIERLKNVTDHINQQHENIEKFLRNHLTLENNRIDKEENTLNDIQYINLINYNIDLLSNHISNIAESIVLAKLNVISKFILSHEELENISKNLPIETISNEQIYELLGLQAYYNDSNIIFNIKIPIISLEKSRFFHLIPLPINKTKEIITKPYITYNKNNIRFYDEPCLNIEKQFFCHETENKEVNDESSCIGQTLQNKTAHCNFNDVGYIQSISSPENSFILFKNMPKTLIISNCRTPLQEVEGTALIKFKNCTVNINGAEYEDKQQRYWDQVNLTTLAHSKIHAKAVNEILSLQKLKQFEIQNNENVVEIKRATTKTNVFTYTAIGILCVAILAVFLYATKKIRVYYISQLMQDSAPAPPNSLWPSLYSKGGGVTYNMQNHLNPNILPPPKPKRNNNNNVFSSNESVY